jgi:N-acetylmuramic acid 6-phosphate etherase
MTKIDLDRIPTEQRNPRTLELDAMPTLELLTVMNDEDRTCALAVQQALPQIAAAVDAIAARMKQGGRLLYFGAGTSGRLGVLDAVECEPTFSSKPGEVVGVIAGGLGAMMRAVEGAEDDVGLGKKDVQELAATALDCVVAIAASGRTPYVLGALDEAKSRGALRIAVACAKGSAIAAAAEIAIEVVTGPEVLTGSTRLKAGTATKLVLNMLSTAAFVRRNKVYGNLMVDVQATNLKLVERMVRIVATATGKPHEDARVALANCGNEAKTAIVALRCGVDAAVARARIAQCDGSVRKALEMAS